MADVQTFYQSVLRELRQDAISVPQKTKDDIMLSLAESLKYNRAFETWFNRKSHSLELEEDVFAYTLPKDFLGVVGAVFYRPFSELSTATAATQRRLRDGSQDMIEEFRYYATDFTAPVNTFTKGEAELYAVDDTNRQMLFSPIPSTAGGRVLFRYLADLGTITYKHDGTNWTFYEPNSTTTITVTSTYTNPWFNEGIDMLRERAMYYLWSRIYGGSEEGETKAQRALLQWKDAQTRINAEGGRKQSIRTIRSWI